MNELIVYNVWHVNPYDLAVLAYFFLGGMGGGAFFVSAFAKISGGEKYNDVVKTGALCSVIVVGIGGLCLLFDLGHPGRMFYLFLNFNPTSPISWGGLIITLFFVTTLIYLYYVITEKEETKIRLWAWAGVLVALCLSSYTGFLLSMAKAKPLWHSAIMPPLFLISSSISGLALVMLVLNLGGTCSPKSDIMKIMRRTIIVLILIDIFFLSDMYVLYVGISEAHEIARLLLFGEFAFLFWGVELLIGSVLPVVILSTKRLAETKEGQVTASILSLIGVLAMRYIIVIIGQHLPIS